MVFSVVFVGQLLCSGCPRFAEPFLLEFLENFVAEVEVGYRPFLGKTHDAKALRPWGSTGDKTPNGKS